MVMMMDPDRSFRLFVEMILFGSGDCFFYNYNVIYDDMMKEVYFLFF